MRRWRLLQGRVTSYELLRYQEFRYCVKALRLIEANPYYLLLSLHALKESFNGLHSVPINLSFQITMEMIISDKDIILINVGDHDEVYR